MTFASILGRIRRKRKEQAATASDSYYSMIRSVSSGTEIDADEAATIIENAGKTEDDFESDILVLAKVHLTSVVISKLPCRATLASVDTSCF